MTTRRPKSQARAALAALGLPPRVLELDLAAAYVGLSADAFLAAVDRGAYPPPLADGRRRQWDRAALDAAVDRRSGLAASLRKETPDDLTRAIDGA